MPNSLTDRLKALSSAEDFLTFFGVSYDEKVVHVNRLHILKRFYQYLHKSEAPDSETEVDTFRRYRELLIQAHGDFVNSSAIKEKVFKVFQDADGQKAVPVANLRESLAERRRVMPTPEAPAALPPQGGAASGLAKPVPRQPLGWARTA